MSTWTERISFNLGPAKAGISASLRGQRWNPDTEEDIGVAITQGFIDRLFGSYVLVVDFDSDNGDVQMLDIFDGTSFRYTWTVTNPEVGGLNDEQDERLIQVRAIVEAREG